jgi:hypothetical protein
MTAKEKPKLTVAEINVMLQTVKYTWMAYKRSYDILNELKI